MSPFPLMVCREMRVSFFRIQHTDTQTVSPPVIDNVTYIINTYSSTFHSGGVIFGGFQAALADPVPALACTRIFKGYDCWTRKLSIDFRQGGSTDLQLRFEFDEQQEKEIQEELDRKGYATPTFELGYYLTDGSLASVVSNTVAIRQPGHKSRHDRSDTQLKS